MKKFATGKRTHDGGRAITQRRKGLARTKSPRIVRLNFDERLRDWQDIAQGYQEGASQ